MRGDAGRVWGAGLHLLEWATLTICLSILTSCSLLTIAIDGGSGVIQPFPGGAERAVLPLAAVTNTKASGQGRVSG